MASCCVVYSTFKIHSGSFFRHLHVRKSSSLLLQDSAVRSGILSRDYSTPYFSVDGLYDSVNAIERRIRQCVFKTGRLTESVAEVVCQGILYVRLLTMV